jgi:hypothetical protein
VLQLWLVLQYFSLSVFRTNTLNSFHRLLLFGMTSSEGGKDLLFCEHNSANEALWSVNLAQWNKKCSTVSVPWPHSHMGDAVFLILCRWWLSLQCPVRTWVNSWWMYLPLRQVASDGRGKNLFVCVPVLMWIHSCVHNFSTSVLMLSLSSSSDHGWDWTFPQLHWDLILLLLLQVLFLLLLSPNLDGCSVDCRSTASDSWLLFH